MKRISILAIVSFLLFVMPAHSAKEPFAMDVNYYAAGNLLHIELERLSRDEIEHFMQRLVIYTGEGPRTEESMIEQNHLNEITKFVPYQADVGETIFIELHYGDKKVFRKAVRVVPNGGGKFLRNKFLNTSQVGESLLIKDDVTLGHDNAGPGKKKPSIKEKILPRKPQFGYEDEGKQNVGREGFGYEEEEKSYGYSDMTKDDYYKRIYGHNVYDEKGERKIYGNEDAGHRLPDEKVYGGKGYGYEGDKRSYGRKTYER